LIGSVIIISQSEAPSLVKVITEDGLVTGIGRADGPAKKDIQRVDSRLENGLYNSSTNTGLKRIDYEYDLVSGKVNFVRYQDNMPDRFYYSYDYDADNRLTIAWSGTTAMVDTLTGSQLLSSNKRRDAYYQYYLHGPLARMELGDVKDKVQGVDYAYTLQGWLKGVNSTSVVNTSDMGQDNNPVARDAYGYALYYYGNGSTIADYTPIGGVNPFSTAPAGLSTFSALQNGNIAASSMNIPQLTDPWHYYTYQYDQLNRLRTTKVNKVTTGTVTPVNDYKETFTYDGNGNIDSLTRYMGAGLKMDSLRYNYNTSGGRLSNNRLNYITDSVTTKTWPYGLDNQAVNNYTYDAIGDMTADVIDTISNVNWTVYGKIQNLTNSKGTITYSYDPSGQRVTSTASGVTTYYVRDAQGNTLALYNNQGGYTYLKEQDLYGSSRLGLWQPNIRVGVDSAITTYDTIGRKQYELSNHLGNVMATVTDKRIAHDSGDHITADYYLADVATAKEYYAFGGLMPGRTFDEDTTYRYGFNGKENDNEVKGVGNQQDYGMRIYDPRVGRFLSVDPLTLKYSGLTPYQFASNIPIDGVDIDGLEFKDKSYYSLIVQTSTVFSISTSTIVVAYNANNRPDYFIKNNLYPEKASILGYEQRTDQANYNDNYVVRPDYSAIAAFAQDVQTNMITDEPTLQNSRPRGIEFTPRPVTSTPGAAFNALSLFRQSWQSVASFFGENAALNEAFYDKVTFYASINLVNNYFRGQKLNDNVKVDLVNYVNSKTLPFSGNDIKIANGKDRQLLIQYNKYIEKTGGDIYKSRGGYGNNGSTSTNPADKNAVPYQ